MSTEPIYIKATDSEEEMKRLASLAIKSGQKVIVVDDIAHGPNIELGAAVELTNRQIIAMTPKIEDLDPLIQAQVKRERKKLKKDFQKLRSLDGQRR